MINLTQEMILAAGARKRRAQLRIGERTAKRANAADRPERHDGETRRQISDLKTQAGEDARAHHVGDHDAGRGEERDRSRTLRRRARTHWRCLVAPGS